MKTLILLLALLTTSMASAGERIDPGTIAFVNDITTGHSVWITVYNAVGNISAYGCVPPGVTTKVGGYVPGLSYKVRGEVKENLDCGGRTLFDDSGSDIMAFGILATMSRTDEGNYYYNVDHCGRLGACETPDEQ